MSKRYPLTSVLLSQVLIEPRIFQILLQIVPSRLIIQELTTLANNDTYFLCPTRGLTEPSCGHIISSSRDDLCGQNAKTKTRSLKWPENIQLVWILTTEYL